MICAACQGQDQQSANAQNNLVIGGPFENGEFMYIDMPKHINSVDTSNGWHQKGRKLLITGTTYKNGGKVPASGVILYYYHTNVNGYYADKEGLNSRVARHGHIRGWVKSDRNGKYEIYTVRPAAYPDRGEPAHIHVSIKEPGIEKEYYIDEFVFDDDPLLTSAKRIAMGNRGGSGVLRLLESKDLLIAEHDIILGLNIPNYPTTKMGKTNSGREIGEDVLSFTPIHAWGPDRGTTTCPICKYGRHHGLLFFVGNSPNWEAIKKWLFFLEIESLNRGEYFKAYLVLGNKKGYEKTKRMLELEKIGQELSLRNVALTFVPSFSDQKSDVYLNKINPAVENTMILFKNSRIIEKAINLAPTDANFKWISNTLYNSFNEFFYLPRAKK